MKNPSLGDWLGRGFESRDNDLSMRESVPESFISSKEGASS